MYQSSFSQYAGDFLRIFDRESDPSRTFAQGSEEDLVTTRPPTVKRKPGPKVVRAPDPPTPTKNSWLPDLDAFNITQRNMFVATEQKIVAMKNDLPVGNLDELVLVNCAHSVN